MLWGSHRHPAINPKAVHIPLSEKCEGDARRGILLTIKYRYASGIYKIKILKHAREWIGIAQ